MVVLHELQTALNGLNDRPSVCSYGIWKTETEFLVRRYIEENVLPCQIAAGLGVNFQGLSCFQDQDCNLTSLTGCDLLTYTCLITNQSAAEETFLKCYIERMDSFTEQWLRSNVLNSSTISRNSTEFFIDLQNAASVSDCLGISLLDWDARSQFRLDLDPIIRCLTTACQIDANTELFCAE